MSSGPIRIAVAGLWLSTPDVDEGRRSVWAHPWPSGLALAERIATELAPRLRGRDVVELGCGLGAAGLSAARVGARVTLTDGEPEALALAAANARDNGLEAQVRLLAWDRVPDDLIGGFDAVVAADVAYDRAQRGALLAAIEALLRPGGEAWLADPQRISAADLALRAGLLVEDVATLTAVGGTTSDDSGARDVVMYRLRRA